MLEQKNPNGQSNNNNNNNNNKVLKQIKTK